MIKPVRPRAKNVQHVIHITVIGTVVRRHPITDGLRGIRSECKLDNVVMIAQIQQVIILVVGTRTGDGYSTPVIIL